MNVFYFPNLLVEIFQLFFLVYTWNVFYFRVMLLTVEEYANKVGKTDKAIYKQIKENRVKYTRKYGRILVYYNPNK